MKHCAYVLFGTDAVKNYLDEGIVSAQAGYDLIRREFNTEAEVKAYYKGLDDGDGWRMYHTLNREESADVVRRRLSALLEDTDEQHPMDTHIVIETEESQGLSTLQMPTIIKIFQHPTEGIIYVLYEGTEDYVEVEDDDTELMWQIIHDIDV